MSDDAVFRALADPSRRELLDRLREREGQTSQDLCQGLSMSRQAVAKHLSILEAAYLVSTRWKGREKLHFLNPAPIVDAAEGWMAPFKRPLSLSALARPRDEDERIHAREPVVVPAVAGRPRIGSLRALRTPLDEITEMQETYAHQGAGKRTQTGQADSAGMVPRRGLRSLAKLGNRVEE